MKMPQHEFKVHYFNEKSRLKGVKKMACYNFSKRYPAYRLWTTDKEEVTCQHCLNQIAKWDERKKQ
jgi:hypothetical protein